MTTTDTVPASIDQVQNLLRDQQYVTDRGLAVAMYLALTLRRPLFLEGEAGVGKTEIARSLAKGMDTELIPAAVLRGAGYQPRRL